MFILLVSVLLGTGQPVNGDSLVYTHMAIFKPTGAPDVPEFTPRILLNNRPIHVPEPTSGGKQFVSRSWKEQREHLLGEQKEFRHRINFLMAQMKVNHSNVYLQYLYGCEGDVQPDNASQFHRGVDAYNVDGRSILILSSLSNANTDYLWVAHTPEAEPIAKDWNNDKRLMQDTRIKLKFHCMHDLKNLKEYETRQFEAAPPPDIYVFSTEAKVKENLVLSCLATGFYPTDIVLEITRNGRVLTKHDGLMSTGIRPNEDETFQIRDSVEILKSDLSTYSCEIVHAASGLKQTKVWDHAPPLGGDAGAIGGAVGAVVLIVLIVLIILIILGALLFVLYKKGQLGCLAAPDSSHVPMRLISNSKESGSSSSSSRSTDSNLPCSKVSVRSNSSMTADFTFNY